MNAALHPCRKGSVVTCSECAGDFRQTLFPLELDKMFSAGGPNFPIHDAGVFLCLYVFSFFSVPIFMLLQALVQPPALPKPCSFGELAAVARSMEIIRVGVNLMWI